MVAPQAILSILTGGAWILQNRTITVNGTVQSDPNGPLGLHPSGIILYHPNGYMSATMASSTPSQRPLDATYPFETPSDVEKYALIGVHSLCYSGPFSFTGRNQAPGKMQGEILHGPVIMSNLPTWVGTPQFRNFSIFGNGREGWTLRLRTRDEEKGSQGDIWWKRVA